MTRHRIFSTPFGSVYPHYLAKVERRGHSRAELDAVITWLTGYSPDQIARIVAEETDFEAFFAGAPAWQPNSALITGVICGHRVEDIEDPLMQRIRFLDKLVDELARGKKMSSILRGTPA